MANRRRKASPISSMVVVALSALIFVVAVGIGVSLLKGNEEPVAVVKSSSEPIIVNAASSKEEKKADTKKVLMVSRITVFVIAVLAYIIALNPNNTIMGLVSNAWAGLGAAFGPLVLLSLFWKRCNFPGAVAGIVSGALTVIVWDYIPLVAGQTIGKATGLYSLVVGFAVSLVAIVAVSLCTKAPDAEMLQEFEDVQKNNI